MSSVHTLSDDERLLVRRIYREPSIEDWQTTRFVAQVCRLLHTHDQDFACFLRQHKTLDAAWQASRSGTWMIRLATCCELPVQTAVLAAASCADLALARAKIRCGPLHAAVSAAREWVYGNISQDAVAEAYSAADAVFYAACRTSFAGRGLRSELLAEVAGKAACTTAAIALQPDVAVCFDYRADLAFGGLACADVVRRYMPKAPRLPGESLSASPAVDPAMRAG